MLVHEPALMFSDYTINRFGRQVRWVGKLKPDLSQKECFWGMTAYVIPLFYDLCKGKRTGRERNRGSVMSDSLERGRPEHQDGVGPCSLSTEMSVLGAMMLSDEAIAQVIPILTEEAFFMPKHRIIYRAIITLYSVLEPRDVVILRRELERAAALEEIGGAKYLGQLMQSVPSAANAKYYAEIVREKYMLRRLIQAASKMLEEAYSDAHPTGEVLDLAELRIFEITQDRVSCEPESLREVSNEMFCQIVDRGENSINGLATGFTELDTLTGGLQNGELIIVTGWPGTGKTSFGLNIAEHIAVNTGQPTVFFSLEMSIQQVAQRLFCSLGNIDSRDLCRRSLNDEGISRLQTARDLLSNAPLFVDDTPKMGMCELRSKVRLMKVRQDIQAVFVDYLQLLGNPGSESQAKEIRIVSKRLKALARELNVPVVVMAGLDHVLEGCENRQPRIDDLNGNIKREADLIILLHRQDYHRTTGRDTSVGTAEKAEAIIAKHRNGLLSTVPLQFSKKYLRFDNFVHGSEAVHDC